MECPVQLEATVESVHPLAERDEKWHGRLLAIEVRIRRVHLSEAILAEDDSNRIDPDKWRPLIMSFQHFYGLTPNRLSDSRLARIPESLYRAS
jgi:flavin reductase (DIM6/NTAB) family NADH-FMN oxidoreductase RutF